MNIRETMEEFEHKWLRQAYGFCRQCFSGVFLPSHDETHHLRTWHFARGLIPGFHRNIHPLTADQIEGILLAVMLHDTGMSKTPDITHGHESRRLAEVFFGEIPASPALAPEILEAIEKHDDKTYITHPSQETDEGIILSLLSLADDMDAFGNTGVFRYYEIYRLRGIPVGQLAEKVIPNLDQRYRTLAEKLSVVPDTLQQHRERYLITRHFFEDLHNKMPEALAVIDAFDKFIRVPRTKPEKAIPEILKNPGNKYVTNFFTSMQNELALSADLQNI